MVKSGSVSRAEVLCKGQRNRASSSETLAVLWVSGDVSLSFETLACFFSSGDLTSSPETQLVLWQRDCMSYLNH